jgi:Mlc titration factor MtfA (ptsG expression regulator)
VILSWKHVVHGGADPRDGENLVIHEFAHKLDMLDASADGFAPTAARADKRAQVTQELGEPIGHLLSEEYDALREALRLGLPTLLRPYAATSPAEFFAVSSEVFFERGDAMRDAHPRLYEALARMYRADPAAWSGSRGLSL